MISLNIITVLSVVIGTILGFALRTLKLSAALGMSLLLPLCFVLKPYSVLLILISIYCGASITHSPKTKKNLADFCISMVFTFSLVLVIPLLINFALIIDKVQFLALCVFCITSIICFEAYCISFSDRGDIRKTRFLAFFLSAMSAMTGLMIPTIGIDVGTGAQRYSMRVSELYGGIDFIIVALGVCCLGEILYAVSKPKGQEKGNDVIQNDSGDQLLNILKISEILPAITLGVPFSQASAVLAGTFAAYGIPQAEFMNGFPYNTIPTVIALSIVMQTIIRTVYEKIMRSNRELLSPVALYPIFTIVAFVGAYSINYRLFDVFTLIAFGLLGFAMKRLSIPTTPLIICVSFGSYMEGAYRAPFSWSLITGIFYLLTIIVLVMYIKNSNVQK